MTGGLDTLSVLFTDVVGSTAQRAALGDDAADDLQRGHDALVADAVDRAGGVLVKRLGDGALATFPSAADAVAAAVSVQQAVELHCRHAPEQAFAVRVGISVGDVTVEIGDVLGTPVVEAARLCAAAVGGEILVAELVRLLARGRGGFVFEPIGELELKGFSDPVAACRVTWDPVVEADQAGDTVALPHALVVPSATGYVGREDLLGALERAWQEASAGAVRTVLLAGEPGIGKTRTAAEVARQAHERGAVVLFGRSDEDLGVPYQPFVEALDWYARESRGPRLGRLPGELTRLVPELPSLVGQLPAPVGSDARSEEYRLFEAAASWLVEASRPSGLVLVLDDLHWAARPTLLLLLHAVEVAAAAGPSRLLILATYRDTDIDRAHPLAATLSDLRRLPGVERLAVDGLTMTEVLALVERAAGHDLDEDTRQLARAIFGETEGNPFFVAEVLRHLVETGGVRRVEDRWVVDASAVSDVPEGVRDVVGRRVSRLSSAANSVLSIAAVIGRDISLDVVVGTSDLGEDEVVDAFDEGVRARLLDETGAERFHFAHALVRTTLYEELSATRRRRLHRRIADVLEKLRPDDVVALAHHTMQAGPDGGDISRAARYSIAAGEQALAGRALADAETRFRQALELLEDSELPVEELVLQALCGLGEAQRDQGNPAYRETLLGAGQRALALGATDLAVRAVLTNNRGYSSVIGGVDPERVELIERTISVGSEEPGADRARLLALLASEIAFSGDDRRRVELSTEAETMARELADPALLAEVLVRTGFAATDVTQIDRYRARADEAVELADGLGDPGLRVVARHYSSAAAIVAGDLARARAITDELRTLAADASPSHAWLAEMLRVRFLAVDGALAEASAQNDRCLAIGEAQGEPDRFNLWAAMGAIIAWCFGNGGAMADLAGEFAERYPTNMVWRAAHAAFLAEAGRIAESRAVLDEWRLDPVELLEGPFPLHGVVILTTLAHRLHDVDLARGCMVALTPYQGRWPHYYLGIVPIVDFDLGMCAATMGDLDAAIDLLDHSVRKLREQGCAALVDWCELEMAAVVLQRGQPGDQQRAASLLRGLIDRTAVTGAFGFQRRAAELLSHC